MNHLDIIITVPLIYGLIKGFSNGLIKEVSMLAALFIGVYVAINFSLYLEPKIEGVLREHKEFVSIVSFAIMFLISVLCIKTIGFVFEKITKALALGLVSRFLGAVFGLLKVIVLFSFLLFIITDYNLITKKTKDDSVLYKPLSNISKTITPKLKKPITNINTLMLRKLSCS